LIEMRNLSKKKLGIATEIVIPSTLNQNIATVEKRGLNISKKKAGIERAIEIEIEIKNQNMPKRKAEIERATEIVIGIIEIEIEIANM